jgi:2-polyprenyl-3-methyl-5-hydroxy-6-metoxy-1,4-benzoquinol methylase
MIRNLRAKIRSVLNLFELTARTDYNLHAIVELQRRLDKLEDTPQAMRQFQLRYEADLRTIRSDWRATLYTQQQALLGAARALVDSPTSNVVLDPAGFQGHIPDLALTHPFRTLLPEALDAQARTGQASWLDLGCGTGSWMQELSTAGINPRGVDHRQAVAATQLQGLIVQVASESHALAAETPGKLAGVSAFYLLERMSPQAVPQLIAAAWAALAPGGVLMLSGANPENLAVAVFGLWTTPERTRLWLPKILADYSLFVGFNSLQILRWRMSNSGAPLLEEAQPESAYLQPHPDADMDHLINQSRCAPEHWALIARKPL